jgi:polygalacturonase
VLDYGADPIGRTDSTRAFQQAIDAAAGSGTVHFPARGTYRIRHSNYF